MQSSLRDISKRLVLLYFTLITLITQTVVEQDLIKVTLEFCAYEKCQQRQGVSETCQGSKMEHLAKIVQGWNR